MILETEIIRRVADSIRFMPPKHVRTWVEALESNKYLQGLGYLRKDTTHCCLGVFGEEVIAPARNCDLDRLHYKDEEILVAGIAATFGIANQAIFVHCNDGQPGYEIRKHTFLEIAAYIRAARPDAFQEATCATQPLSESLLSQHVQAVIQLDPTPEICIGWGACFATTQALADATPTPTLPHHPSALASPSMPSTPSKSQPVELCSTSLAKKSPRRRSRPHPMVGST